MLMLIAVWPLVSAAYLLFVGQASADEVGLAIACGLGATLWLGVVAGAAGVRFRFELEAAAAAVRALAGLPLGVARTAGALMRGYPGRVVGQRFVEGRERDPADAARRAVAVLAVSLAPDRFVLRILEGRDRLEVHGFTAAPAESDARWPA